MSGCSHQIILILSAVHVTIGGRCPWSGVPLLRVQVVDVMKTEITRWDGGEDSGQGYQRMTPLLHTRIAMFVPDPWMPSAERYQIGFQFRPIISSYGGRAKDKVPGDMS
jgi:hypothetical protein